MIAVEIQRFVVTIQHWHTKSYATSMTKPVRDQRLGYYKLHCTSTFAVTPQQ